MNRIAKFHKVSWEQFFEDYIDAYGKFGEDKIETIRTTYDNITLPKRGTSGSAGYDISSPVAFVLQPNEVYKLPTGIRCSIDEGWVLKCYPRSSVGFKYQVCMVNTTPIIDSDYFFANNEGHIFIKLRNDGDKPFVVNAGDRIVQGIFVPYGITVDDNVEDERRGGIGSTGV